MRLKEIPILDIDYLNPLLPSAAYMRRSAKILILIWEGIIKKIFLWASRLWVGRRKEPTLGYVEKLRKKKNSGSKGLNTKLQKFARNFYNLTYESYKLLFP